MIKLGTIDSLFVEAKRESLIEYDECGELVANQLEWGAKLVKLHPDSVGISLEGWGERVERKY